MSLIFGIMSKNGIPLEAPWLDSMMSAMPEYVFDRDLRLQQSQICVGKQLVYNTPESLISQQLHYKDINNTTVAFDGRIDNREHLARELSISCSQLASMSDEKLLALGFRAWGEQLCEKILGDFALVIASDNSVLISRDHIGVRPLYICESKDYIAFASNKRPLLKLPWVSREQNSQWIADLLCMVKVDKHTSYYKDISSMLPAHYRVFKTGRCDETNRLQRYWALDVNRTLAVTSDEDVVETFRGLLDDAVRCRLRSAYPIATELSGGLDSTNVTAVANRWIADCSNHPLIACSHVFAAHMRGKVFPYQDESEQIAQFIHLNKLTICQPVTSIDKSAKECIEQNVKRHGSPSRSDLTQYGGDLLESLKPYNARVLLSGYGGDQLVSSFALGARDEMIAEGRYAELWRDLKATHTGITAGYRWLLWLMKANLPVAGSLSTHWGKRKEPLLHNWNHFLTKLFIQPEYAAMHGYPERHFAYPPWLQSGSVRERERYLIERATLAYRLEDSAVGAEYYGVEYRYPLLDKRLLEFCLALPSNQKYRDGTNRRMMRIQGKGVLPESIRTYKTKVGTGSTIPNANYRRVKDKALFVASLKRMNRELGEIEHSDINKLMAYASNLTSQPDRSSSTIPRAFDKTYQVLYTQMQGESL